MSFENSQVKCKLLVSFQSDMRNKDLMLTDAACLSCQDVFCDSPMCKICSITICRFLSNRTEAGAAGNPQEPGVCTPEFLHIDGDTKGRRAGPGRAFRKPFNFHLEVLYFF